MSLLIDTINSETDNTSTYKKIFSSGGWLHQANKECEKSITDEFVVTPIKEVD